MDLFSVYYPDREAEAAAILTKLGLEIGYF